MKTAPLRRLRLLQHLAMGAPAPLSASLLLKLLEDDPELSPTLAKVLLSLIWLEDRGLAEVRTYDTEEGPVALAGITSAGERFLHGPDPGIPGIIHPSRLLGAN